MTLPNPEPDSGLSVLDFGDLPSTQRKTMRLMLRQREVTYPDLCQVVDALPEAERLTRSELDDALKNLTEQQWLIRSGEAPVIYKVNFRRGTRPALARDIWNVLDSVDSEAGKQLKKLDLGDAG